MANLVFSRSQPCPVKKHASERLLAIDSCLVLADSASNTNVEKLELLVLFMLDCKTNVRIWLLKKANIFTACSFLSSVANTSSTYPGHRFTPSFLSSLKWYRSKFDMKTFAKRGPSGEPIANPSISLFLLNIIGQNSLFLHTHSFVYIRLYFNF